MKIGVASKRWQDLFAPMKLAAYATIGLVWMELSYGDDNVLAALGWSRELALNATMGAYLAAFFLQDLPLPRALQRSLLLLQIVAGWAAVGLEAGGTGPILFVIIAAQLRADFSLRRALLMLAAINIVVYLEIWLLWHYSQPWLAVALYVGFQAFALFAMHVARQAEDSRDELKLINAQLMAARELLATAVRDRERLRLARELHDIAGHGLTALKLTLRNLESHTQPAGTEDLAQAQGLTDELLQNIRSFVGQQRRTDGIPIRPALERLVEPFERPRFELDVPDDFAIDDPQLAHAVIRSLQEAVTNVVRHANAERCRIKLAVNDDAVTIVCRDDGIGLDPARLGHGLNGMRERFEEVGGAMALDSAPGQGTALRLSWARS